MSETDASKTGFSGRAAIVTGAGKGVGRAIAEELAGAGLGVLINNRRRPDAPDSASDTARSIVSAGRTAVPEWSDVSAPGAPQAIVDAAKDAFGRLDVLVLNAGVAGDAKLFREADPEDFAAVMRINFDANVGIVRAALPLLLTGEAPRIVFIASTAGLYGVRGRAAYAASKGALLAFAQTLAAELQRDGVIVNSLLPYAATQMTGATQAGDDTFSADKVRPMAGWLCSPECDQTGGVWIVGGGHHARAMAMEATGWSGAASAADIPAGLPFIDDMSGAQNFRHAEAAFANFAGRAAAAKPEAAE